MAVKQRYSAKDEQQLMADIWSPEIRDDPFAFVMFVFPWGEPGTPLEHFPGPRTWQREILKDIARAIAENQNRGLLGEPYEMVRDATASGRGIGKSALVAWLVLWMQSCHLGSTVIVTANTENQLKTKTWAELGRWHTMAINSHWFERAALSLRPAPWFADACKRKGIDDGYYYASAQLWNEDDPDAFAGAHNHNGLFLIMDEASGIPNAIFDVSQGFFTEPILHRYWFLFGNPRRLEGGFHSAFRATRSIWNRRHIDSRTVEGVDTKFLEDIIAEYGEDSDVARVEVRGLFPTTGENQFISPALADAAAVRDVAPDTHAPLVLGVDVARFGDDRSVICFRQGRDARSIPWRSFKGLDTVQLAQRVAELVDRYNPDAIFVDGGGVGGGVVDNLKARGYAPVEVQFGRRADDQKRYFNHRIEMWDRTREWLEGGAIPDQQDLKDDLAAPTFRYAGDDGRQILESKEDMKRRGLASPDWADALVVTFSKPVARRDARAGRSRRRRQAVGVGEVDFS